MRKPDDGELPNLYTQQNKLRVIQLTFLCLVYWANYVMQAMQDGITVL